MKLIIVLLALLIISSRAEADLGRASTSAASVAGSTESSRPAVEVTGRAGTFELTLRLLEREVDLWEGVLHYQITLRNTGKSDVVVVDDAYRDHTAIVENGKRRVLTHVIFADRNGKELSELDLSWARSHGDDDRTLDPNDPDDAKTLALWREWEKQGLSQEEISARFLEQSSQAQMPFVAVLKPGEALSTGPRKHERRALGDYVGLPYNLPDRTGVYKIRAVFDTIYRKNVVYGDGSRPAPIPNDQLVRVETSWIEFRVTKTP